ncbi:unnamed protein product [Nyctereutes procyonoides]|uniref:(raccoon dog) hypothetical protein n=1 Tax=Nyctereutes procyonoides TaxID=34880 RepID=A0A811Y6Z4_NYCPR|nr:unnamed protein product [Nyctereutes procyonoides]
MAGEGMSLCTDDQSESLFLDVSHHAVKMLRLDNKTMQGQMEGSPRGKKPCQLRATPGPFLRLETRGFRRLGRGRGRGRGRGGLGQGKFGAEGAAGARGLRGWRAGEVTGCGLWRSSRPGAQGRGSTGTGAAAEPAAGSRERGAGARGVSALARGELGSELRQRLPPGPRGPPPAESGAESSAPSKSRLFSPFLCTPQPLSLRSSKLRGAGGGVLRAERPGKPGAVQGCSEPAGAPRPARGPGPRPRRRVRLRSADAGGRRVGGTATTRLLCLARSQSRARPGGGGGSHFMAPGPTSLSAPPPSGLVTWGGGPPRRPLLGFSVLDAASLTGGFWEVQATTRLPVVLGLWPREDGAPEPKPGASLLGGGRSLGGSLLGLIVRRDCAWGPAGDADPAPRALDRSGDCGGRARGRSETGASPVWKRTSRGPGRAVVGDRGPRS